MSNEIQSISQSNYVLHNIDAKKLYVQEPLFTANSGDAVYVGWRPDETVLWEGTGNSQTTTFTVSESMSRFNEIKAIVKINNVDTVLNTSTNNTISASYRPCGMIFNNDSDGAPLQIFGVSFSSNDGLTYNKVRQELRWFLLSNAASVNGVNDISPTFYKIIGVNRKENA